MPAGSSAAELIRKPVLKRVKVVCSSLLELFKFWLAVKALMFVLIRVMSVPQTKGLCPGVRGITRTERFVVGVAGKPGALSTLCLRLIYGLHSNGLVGSIADSTGQSS